MANPKTHTSWQPIQQRILKVTAGTEGRHVHRRLGKLGKRTIVVPSELQ